MRIVAAYILLIVIATSCTKVVDNSSGTSSGSSKTYLSLTVIDSTLPAKNFVITANDGVLVTSPGYLNAAGYFVIANGKTDIKIQSQQNGSVLYDTSVNLSTGSINTAFAFSYNNSARATVVQKDYSTPATGKAKVRLLDVWNGLGNSAVDFTISDGANTFVFLNDTF